MLWSRQRESYLDWVSLGLGGTTAQDQGLFENYLVKKYQGGFATKQDPRYLQKYFPE